MKALVIIAFVLSGLLLIAWPFLAFGSLFLLDAPSRSPLHGYAATLAMLSIFAYPLVWLLALIFAIVGLRKDFHGFFILAAVAAPYLLALFALVCGYLWEKAGKGPAESGSAASPRSPTGQLVQVELPEDRE